MTNNIDTRKHIAMLHNAAKGIDGKLVLASFGENPETGKKLPPEIDHFKIGDIDGMTKAALDMSREEHRNVYAPLAVMRPDLLPTSKGRIEDIVAVLGFVADFDDGLGANYAERCAIEPSYALETSPNNIQAGFILKKPLLIETDKDRVFAKQLAEKLAHACDGADDCSKDISHVWRIAGLANYPNKKKLNAGRSSQPFYARVDLAYSEGQISIPDIATLPSNTLPENEYTEAAEVEYIQSINTRDLKGQGHYDLVDSIEKKYSGDKSELAASVTSQLLKLGHGTGDIIECFYKHPDGIGERYKGDKNRIEDDIVRMATKWFNKETSDKADLSFTLEKLKPINEYEIPTRQWVLGNHLLKGKVSLFIAPPGVGKSTFSLSMGASIAADKPLLCLPVHEHGAVAFVNNEDDKEEMQRRIAALMKFHAIDYNEIDNKFFLQSGDVMQLCIAKRDPVSKTVIAHHKQALIDFCIEKNIEVLFVDPFLETHEADENDNRQISEVAKMYREVAQKANCAVCLIHHTRKEQGNSSKGHAGNMDSGRGASSLVGAARIVFTLYNMDETAAKEYGIAEDDRHLYVRLDEAKGNMSLISNQAKWFIRESVTLGNGEGVGVLSPAENMNSVFKDQNLSHEQELIAAIMHDEAFEEILEKGTATKAGFANAMINSGTYLGSRTETRSTVEKRMEKFLLGKGIKHNGYNVHMTVQKAGKQSRYIVSIELDEQPDATLPLIPEKMSGIVENTGLVH